MKFKSLILGTASAFMVVGGAQAADLAVAEPVDYVRICDMYGTGFFYVPGSNTCLKIGARVRFDGSFSDTAGAGRGYNFVTKGYISATGMWESELGAAKLFIEAEGAFDGVPVGEDTALKIGDVYGKLNGWLFGRTGSVANVDGWFGDAGGPRHDYGVNQVSWSGSMGGLGVAIGVEEGSNWGDTWNTLPNLSAAVWGSAGGVTIKATATVADRTFVGGDVFGYGFNLNASADMGGIAIRGNVAWSHDAPALAGGTNSAFLGAAEGDVMSALIGIKAPIAGPISLTAGVGWIDQGADTTSVEVGLEGNIAANVFARLEGHWSTTGGVDSWDVISRLQWALPGT